MVDAFKKHGLAVTVEVFKHLHVRRQAARADADNQPPFQHVIEHGDVGGEGGRVAVGKVQRAGTQLDLVRGMDQTCKEHETRRNGFGQIGRMFANIGLHEPQLVRQNDGFAVFLEGFEVVAARRVQGHGEVTELHGFSLTASVFIYQILNYKSLKFTPPIISLLRCHFPTTTGLKESVQAGGRFAQRQDALLPQPATSCNTTSSPCSQGTHRQHRETMLFI